MYKLLDASRQETGETLPFTLESRDHLSADIEIVIKIFEREKELGVLNTATASLGMSKIVQRGLRDPLEGEHVNPHLYFSPADVMMSLFASPLGKLIATDGEDFEVIARYRALYDFVYGESE